MTGIPHAKAIAELVALQAKPRGIIHAVPVLHFLLPKQSQRMRAVSEKITLICPAKYVNVAVIVLNFSQGLSC
jgi:hypothetical protein